MLKYIKNSYLYLFLILLLSIFLVSCSSTKQYNFNVIGSKQVANIIETNKIHAVYYKDIRADKFSISTKEWVQKVFIPDYKKFIFNNDLGWAVEGSNDCDKYVVYALARVNLLFFKEPNKDKTAGLAVGQLIYFIEFERHIIIFFIINNNGKQEILFFDPTFSEIVIPDEYDLEHAYSFVI